MFVRRGCVFGVRGLPDSMVSVGKHAAEHGKIYMMNLSAPFVCQFFKDPMHRVLPYADFVFGNESEARAYGDANDLHASTLPEVALKIASLPKVGLRCCRWLHTHIHTYIHTHTQPYPHARTHAQPYTHRPVVDR